jgi:hypothetical protein
MSKKHCFITGLLLSIVCFSGQAFAQSDTLPAYFNGITLDAVQILTTKEPLSAEQQKARDALRNALEGLPIITVVRVVFDKDTRPSEYSESLNYLRSLKLKNGKRKIYIMGELLDSDFLARYRWDCNKGDGCTKDETEEAKFHDYKTRINTYLKALDAQVDIWEVGNEVNGEWADEGCVKKSDGGCFSDTKEETDEDGNKGKSKPNPSNTAKKIEYAIKEVIKKKKPIALTLIHQPECTTWDKNTMFAWATANLRSRINRYKIDYLLISYYEDNCDNGEQTIEPEISPTGEEIRKFADKEKDQRQRNIYWTKTFNQLQNLFSSVEHVGFGEVGYSSDMKTCVDDEISYCKDGNKAGSKLDLLNRYYGMQVTNPKYIGGHFWWTAQEDIIYTEFYRRVTEYFKKQ